MVGNLAILVGLTAFLFAYTYFYLWAFRKLDATDDWPTANEEYS
jgi:uncharacterized membrane protein